MNYERSGSGPQASGSSARAKRSSAPPARVWASPFSPATPSPKKLNAATSRVSDSPDGRRCSATSLSHTSPADRSPQPSAASSRLSPAAARNKPTTRPRASAQHVARSPAPEQQHLPQAAAPDVEQFLAVAV